MGAPSIVFIARMSFLGSSSMKNVNVRQAHNFRPEEEMKGGYCINFR